MIHALGEAAAAALVGTPRGTLSAWAHRQLVPRGPYDIPKVLGLSLFSRLVAAGLEPKHSSTIVLSLQHRWPAIVAGADKLYLVALRNRQSLAWSICVAGERDLPVLLTDGAVLIDLRGIASTVLDRLGHPRSETA